MLRVAASVRAVANRQTGVFVIRACFGGAFEKSFSLI